MMEKKEQNVGRVIMAGQGAGKVGKIKERVRGKLVF
jgi:hypothetical protein